MARVILIGVLVVLCLGAAAPRGAEETETPPSRQRDLIAELGPELPQPEKEARTDPRFEAARRYTTARQAAAVGAALVMVSALLALYFSGAAARLTAWGRGRPLLGALLAAAAVGAVVAVALLLGSTVRAIALRSAGGALSGALIVKPLCYGLGAAALIVAVAAARAWAPRAWWMAVTLAAVAAAVASAFLLPLPPAGAADSPTAGFLLERARYLTVQYRLPPYEIAVDRRPPADRALVAISSPGRSTIVVSAAAESLDRYEAEVFLATALLKAEHRRKSLLGAVVLIAFMGSLLAAEAISGAVARRRHVEATAPANLPLFAATLLALWFAGLVTFNAWHRHLASRADEEAITLTRKPLAAVTLYYEEAAANLAADEPNPVLHFLVETTPAPAERAARARRLRGELAGR